MVRHLEPDETFDADTGVNHEHAVVRDSDGRERTFDLWTTCYTPRELRLVAARAGLVVDDVFGVHPGRYARDRPSIDVPEHLLLAHRPEVDGSFPTGERPVALRGRSTGAAMGARAHPTFGAALVFPEQSRNQVLDQEPDATAPPTAAVAETTAAEPEAGTDDHGGGRATPNPRWSRTSSSTTSAVCRSPMPSTRPSSRSTTAISCTARS